MANKPQPPSTSGDPALNRSAESRSDPAQPRHERSGKRSAPIGNRELSAMLENPPLPAARAAADFNLPSSREALIATAAYYRAERRGFRPGHEVEDWLDAEREVDRVGKDTLD
jgi:Protein of unknown function (DUF2934)